MQLEIDVICQAVGLCRVKHSSRERALDEIFAPRRRVLRKCLMGYAKHLTIQRAHGTCVQNGNIPDGPRRAVAALSITLVRHGASRQTNLCDTPPQPRFVQIE